MKPQHLLALPLGGLALAFFLSLAPAGAEPNGRPPPIKLGTPSPSPSPAPAPIKIGKPAPSPAPTSAGAQTLSGVDMNQMIDAGLKLKLQPQVFQWSAGQGTVQMAPAATHICLLTGVAGNFAGSGEHIVVQVDNAAAGGARYTLSGTSGQAQLRGSAVCVKKDRFTPGMIATENVKHAAQPFQLNSNCNDARFPIASKGPEYAHFIREIVGKFDGDEDRIRTVTTPESASTYMKACSGYVGGAGSAIHMIGSAPIKYYGPNGRTASASAANFDAWSSKQNNWQATQSPNSWVQGAYYLAPVEQALCGLTKVAGPFGSYGEGAEIVMVQRDGAMWWAAQVGNLGVGTVAMSARCIARDQR